MFGFLKKLLKEEKDPMKVAGYETYEHTLIIGGSVFHKEPAQRDAKGRFVKGNTYCSNRKGKKFTKKGKTK